MLCLGFCLLSAGWALIFEAKQGLKVLQGGTLYIYKNRSSERKQLSFSVERK